MPDEHCLETCVPPLREGAWSVCRLAVVRSVCTGTPHEGALRERWLAEVMPRDHTNLLLYIYMYRICHQNIC